MRGEYVIVRAYRGKPLIRRVWDVGENVVYITNDQQLKLLMKGAGNAVGPIGFPKEDVFKYDPNLAEAIDEFSDKDCFIWDKLKPLIE